MSTSYPSLTSVYYYGVSEAVILLAVTVVYHSIVEDTVEGGTGLLWSDIKHFFGLNIFYTSSLSSILFIS